MFLFILLNLKPQSIKQKHTRMSYLFVYDNAPEEILIYLDFIMEQAYKRLLLSPYFLLRKYKVLTYILFRIQHQFKNVIVSTISMETLSTITKINVFCSKFKLKKH